MLNDGTIVIPSNKNIIIELNGYRIGSAIEDETFRNEGHLEIRDSSENSTGELK